MVRQLAISCFVLISSLASAHPAEVSVVGAKESYDCKGEGAFGGLYEMERGGYVCIRDFGAVIEVTGGSNFSVRVKPFQADGLVGRASIVGWGWRETHTSVGLIGEKMDCPFDVPTKILPLTDDELLWDVPVVSYNTSCCNYAGVRYVPQHLIRAQ